MSAKTTEVEALLKITRRVPVWADATYALTLAEELVLASAPMQRLRRLRQMGLAYHALPMAEHTRFSHSIGVACLAVRMLQAAEANESSCAARMERELGPEMSLPLIVRLFAMLHDVALLPLGHTLRYQIGLFNSQATFDAAMHDCLRRVAEVGRNLIEMRAGDAALLRAFHRHLDLVAAVTSAPRLVAGALPESLTGATDPREILAALPVLNFVYDLVHGVYGADIVDVCLRDLFAAGRHWQAPELLISAGSIVLGRPGAACWPERARANRHGLDHIWRYAVDPLASGSGASAVLSDLMFVHQSRLRVAEIGFYAPRKCVADAMLDKCLRLIGSPGVIDDAFLPELSVLLRMGDDALLDHLVGLEEARSAAPARLAPAIRDGDIYDEVLSLDALATPNCASMCREREGASARNACEAEIARRAGGIGACDVIIGVLPEQMQAKPADTLVVWHSGRVLPFDRLAAEIGYPAPASDMPEQYRQLRRIFVCVPAGHARANAVGAAARQVIGMQPVHVTARAPADAHGSG